MTDKELKKLKRSDLLEILLYLQKENDEIKNENESLKKQIENFKIVHLADEDIKKIVDAINGKDSRTGHPGNEKQNKSK